MFDDTVAYLQFCIFMFWTTVTYLVFGVLCFVGGELLSSCIWLQCGEFDSALARIYFNKCNKLGTCKHIDCYLLFISTDWKPAKHSQLIVIYCYLLLFISTDAIDWKAAKLSIDCYFSGELSEPMVSRVLGETPQVGGRLPCCVFCICLLTQINIRNTNQLSWAINWWAGWFHW